MVTDSTLGPAAVVVQGNNAGSINTGVIVNIQGYDAEKNLAVARALLAASQLASPLEPQRKADIVALLKAIADTLTGAVAELRQGRVPHGKCGELQGHAHHLPGAIADVVGPGQAQALGAKLIESCHIERFGTERVGPRRGARRSRRCWRKPRDLCARRPWPCGCGTSNGRSAPLPLPWGVAPDGVKVRMRVCAGCQKSGRERSTTRKPTN